MLTWWGAASVVLDYGHAVVAIDPYLHPAQVDVDYVLVTHDHYDHCHPPTLRRLVAGAAFKRILVPLSALELGQLDSPIDEGGAHAGLSFVERDQITAVVPKHRRYPRRALPELRTSIRLGRLEVETVDSSERPWRQRPSGGGTWPDGTGAYVGLDAYPNVGYLLRDTESGIGIYHPGDLSEVFDALRTLRGRVDVVLFPVGKLEGRELSFVDAVRPRTIVPIHHRINEPDFPIPLDVDETQLRTTNLIDGAPRTGVPPKDFAADQQRLIAGHWYPTPNPPLDRIRGLEAPLRQLGAELRILSAGEAERLA